MPRNPKLVAADAAEISASELASREQDMRQDFMSDRQLDDFEKKALERVLQKIDQVNAKVRQLRDEVAANKAIWDGRAGDLALMESQLTELQSFGDPEAPAIEGEFTPIREAIPDERWADATAALDQLMMSMEPVYGNYVEQKAAMDRYLLARADFDTRLAAARSTEPKTETVVSGLADIDASIGAIDAAADERAYVDAEILLAGANTRLEQVEAELIDFQKNVADLEAGLGAISGKLDDLSVCEFTSLAEAQSEILNLQTEIEAAVAVHDYVTALALLATLTPLVEDTHRRLEELQIKHADFHATYDPLKVRAELLNSSESPATVEPTQRMLATLDQIDAAVAVEDFDTAISLCPALEEAIVEIETLQDDRALREARAAEIMKQHSKQLREIARLLSMPGNTSKGEELQRRLEFQSEEIERLCAELKPTDATLVFTQMLGTIAALQAEEAAMVAADTLREEAESAYAALKPKIDKAKLFYPIDEEFKAMVEEFREEDEAVTSSIHQNHFGNALVAVDSLERSIDRLLARQADFDARVAVRDTFVVDWEKYEAVRSQVFAMRITLPDVRTLFNAFDTADDVVLEAKNAFDYPAARAAIPAATKAAEAVLKRKKDCDVHAAKYDEAMTRFKTAEALFKPMNAIRDVHTEALWNKLIEGGKKKTAFWEVVRDKPDMTKALKIVGEFEKVVKDLEPIIEAERVAVAERDRLLALQKAAQAKFDAADAVKPNTEEMLTIFKAYRTAQVEFFGSLAGAEPDTEAKLNAYIAAAEAVTNAAAAHAGHEAEAKAACDTRETAVKPKFDAAKTDGETYPTELEDMLWSLEEAWKYYQKLYGEQRYLEARDHLDHVEKAAEELQKGVVAAKVLVDQREVELTGKFTAAFIARLTTVTGYVDSSKEMKEKRTSAIELRTSLETAKTDRLFKEALEHFAALDPLVTDLEALKAAEGPLLADRTWVEAQVTAKQPQINTARAIEGVDRATQAKVDAYDDAQKGFQTPYDDADFTAARAAWPRFDQAIDELNAMQGAYDALRAKKDAADAAWAPLRANYDIAVEMRGLTDELEKLVKDFDAANTLYNKAYNRHDWDQVLIETPLLERAINALVAKKADHDAADAAGAETADAALVELQTMFEADLKSKTTEEKLELLEKLRSQKQELTPEQKDMQRKVYMSMDLDAEFVKQDEERRAELNEAIKNDPELQAARADWDSTHPDTAISPKEKIKLLMKTVKKECEIYGMPVPEIKTFSDPNGDAGFHNPSDNTVNINIHEEVGFDDFFETVDTMTHEVAHHYQATLVERLEEGLLTPDDPEFKQALMFAANSGPYDFIEPEDDHEGYKKQPLEDHAWETGGGVQDALREEPTF
ncbi:MAG: hypothetical protein AB8B60_14275 [Sulfitobacter sp.]